MSGSAQKLYKAAAGENSNETIWGLVKILGGATAEEVLAHRFGDTPYTATEGKRLAQPVYRALSEGAKCGALLEEDQLNEETGFMNTRYTFVEDEAARVPRPGNSWKERYRALLKVNQQLLENQAQDVVVLCRDCVAILCTACSRLREAARASAQMSDEYS